jgi:hypothetical protein
MNFTNRAFPRLSISKKQRYFFFPFNFNGSFESIVSLLFQGAMSLVLKRYYLLIYHETVSRFLPFFLLLASTFRPPFVDILFLKP